MYQFAFPPSHAELLPVRESKKERIAYQSQLEEQMEDLPFAVAPDGVEEVDDSLEGIA